MNMSNKIKTIACPTPEEAALQYLAHKPPGTIVRIAYHEGMSKCYICFRKRTKDGSSLETVNVGEDAVFEKTDWHPNDTYLITIEKDLKEINWDAA